MENESYVGIDVAKNKVNVCCLPQNTHEEYTQEDYPKLAEKLKNIKPTLIVMEATGGYQRAIQIALADHELPVAVINPAHARHFAKAMGRLAKTDDIDAEALALFAQKMQPKPNLCGQGVPDEIKELVARRRQLTGMRVMETNRSHRAEGKLVRKGLQATLRLFDKQIAEVDAAIDRYFRSTPEWNEKREILVSVPGVGEVTARVLLTELPELGTLSKSKIAALAGVAPMNADSGRFRGARHIRGGRSPVRAALYMACVSGIRYNPSLRKYYTHLRSLGKKYKVAMTACMRKLLIILNTMLREKTTFSSRTA